MINVHIAGAIAQLCKLNCRVASLPPPLLICSLSVRKGFLDKLLNLCKC